MKRTDNPEPKKGDIVLVIIGKKIYQAIVILIEPIKMIVMRADNDEKETIWKDLNLN